MARVGSHKGVRKLIQVYTSWPGSETTVRVVQRGITADAVRRRWKDQLVFLGGKKAALDLDL